MLDTPFEQVCFARSIKVKELFLNEEENILRRVIEEKHTVGELVDIMLFKLTNMMSYLQRFQS